MTIEEFKKENGIIGRSKEINDLVDTSMQIAKSDISVLLTGDSGVGKEIFAKAIHNYSHRSGKPMVSVNCGAIPEGILESELFGHKKGSFTGAIESRKGYFEIADGGTLFLDEIAEMPLTTQVKLLRVIENKEFMRIGAETTSKADVRIIAATNKDLQKEVDKGKFREDLYFRLKAVSLSIPPLRKRKGDIEEFVMFFLKRYADENKIKIPEITSEAINVLKNYHWPGNIRELKNTIESASALSRNGVLTEESFYSLFLKVEDDPRSESHNLPVYLRKSPEDADRELVYRALFELKKDIMELKDIILSREAEFEENHSKPVNNEVLPLDEMEKEAIKQALENTNGNKRQAAEKLNISERTLYRKIKQFGL